MPIKKALKWVAFWFSLAMLFDLGIYLLLPLVEKGMNGGQKAMEFLGGYVLEFSLSLDNMFVFLMIFTSFGVPERLQRRTLNFGIAGAIVLRFLFIVLGSALVSEFEWILFIFGGILILSGVQMAFGQEKEKDYQQSKVLKHIDKVIPFTGSLSGEKFIVKREGKRYATLLLGVLIIIELSDILFAVDSIPAIFSLTKDTFVMYTSNIFAILGLRSLYFVIERLSKMFRLVKYGVSLILVFTGIKLLYPLIIELLQLVFPSLPNYTISIPLSIGIIVGILLASILASVWIKEKKPEEN